MRHVLHRRTALACVVLAAVWVSGCAGTSSSSRPHAGVVHVAERDFHIAAPTVLPAGDVDLSVKNSGPDDHELILVREGKSGLPFRSDGLTIDEDAVEHRKAGSLEPGAPGSTRTLRVHLAPGHYVLFCNMSGHYLGGMDKDVVVR